jgi:hypothetical protein
MRRTSHIDMLFGDSANRHGLLLAGRARDLVTLATSNRVVAEAAVRAGIGASGELTQRRRRHWRSCSTTCRWRH